MQITPLAIIGLAVLLPSQAGARIIDRIAAIVNDQIITLSEIDVVINDKKAQLDSIKNALMQEQMLKNLRVEALNRLIAERLIGWEITKRRIQAKTKQIDRLFLVQIKANKTTKKKFLEGLAKHGFTEASYRRYLAKRIRRRNFAETMFMHKVKITEKDIRNTYTRNVNLVRADREVHARHILFLVPQEAAPTEVETIRKQASAVLKQIKSGGSFAKLARKYSKDHTAQKGGDLGYFKRGKVLKPIENEAFRMKKGEISDVVRSKVGFHIIQTLNSRNESVLPYKKARTRIWQQLQMDGLEKLVQQWIKRRRKTAYIKVLL